MLSLAISLVALLLLAMLGAVIFLAVLLLRWSRSQQQSLLQTSEQSLATTRELALTMLERTSSSSSASQQEVLRHLEGQTTQVMAALSSTVNQATGSISSTATKLTELLASTQAMVAAKDPMACQTLRGATFPIAGDDSDEPYTSTEDLALADARRAARMREADEALEKIRSLTGVADEQPYPGAGAGTSYLGPAPTAF